MGKSVILLTHDESSVDIIAQILAASGNRFAEGNLLENYFGALKAGVRKATCAVAAYAVQATGTITFTGIGAASDTVLINGVTFTARASGATGDEWNVGASATLSAAALAAAINASATALISGYVTAANVAGVLTITAVRPGTQGNCMTIAEGVDGSSHMAVSGARLTGGTEGTDRTFYFGGAS